MRCVNCDTELLPGKKFCHNCGTPAAIKCRSCGATLDLSFRFCPDCGAPTAPSSADSPAAAPANRLERLAERIPAALATKIRASRGAAGGERKLVTVLFCDLVGSTAIAEKLDPEEYRDLLDRYLELAFREVYRFEGIVNQLAGDGLMALFGAPIAHEDAPHRAVQAALAIRDALARFNHESPGRHDLQLRIGIHTGPVVVGTVGNDLKMDYTAIGDTTNLAARLQSLAPPGAVLMSEATHRLARGAFEVKAAGPFEVKGKREPVVAYEVTGLSSTLTPMAIAEARGLTPLVGRRSELAQLEACYERLLGTLPQVVSVVGEAGSGKSRLLYEFKRLRAADEVAIFETRCSALTQNVPYAPFIGMLRQYFGLAAGETAVCSCDKLAERLKPFDERLEAIYPYICRLLSLPAPAAAELPADELRRATFEAIAHLVVGLSHGRPLVMIIEDLHWLDDATREMLELAVAKLREARVMFLFSYRPEFQPAWRVRAAFTQLSLLPLSAEDAAAVVRAVAGGSLPGAVEGLILAKAEGNPFFLEEITRALLEEGYLVRTDGRLELARPEQEIQIPGTVQELIGARLDRLDPWAKRVAQVASVFGRQFSQQQVGRLLSHEGRDVAEALAELERRGIIHRKNLLSDDEYRFGESLTQEVAYESLLLRERRQLHERIATLLESEPGDGERPALVAHHFTRSENRLRAVQSLLAAAQHAEKLPSFPAAVAAYRQAWDLAEALLAERDDPPAELRRIAIGAANGLSRMTVFYGNPDWAAGERAARRGRELAEAEGDLSSVAGFYTLHGMILGAGPRERASKSVALIEKGLEIAQNAGLDFQALMFSRALAWAYIYDGRFEPAASILAAALSKLEALGHREQLSDVYFGARFLKMNSLLHTDRLEEAYRSAGETYELAVKASNRTGQGGSSIALATVHYLRGEYAEAKHLADRALAIAEAIGNPNIIRMSAAAALGSRLRLGERVAKTRYLELFDQKFSGGVDIALKVHLLVEILLDAGDLARARGLAELATSLGAGRLREAEASLAMGEVLRHSAGVDQEAAVEHHQRALAIAEEIGAESLAALARLGLAELAHARGDPDAAEEEALRALRMFQRHGLRHYFARVLRVAPARSDAAAETRL